MPGLPKGKVNVPAASAKAKARKRAIEGLRKLRGRLPAGADVVGLVRDEREMHADGIAVHSDEDGKRKYITAADTLADIPSPAIARNLRVVNAKRKTRRSAAGARAAVANWNQFAAEHGSFIDELSYSDHMFYDVLTVALHALAARKILNDPSLIKQARATLERWISNQQPAPRPLIEWRKILADTPQKIAAVAMSLTEEATRLRSSSPLGCVLKPKERVAIYAAFGKEPKSLEDLGEVMRAVARGERRVSPKPKTTVTGRLAAVAERRWRRIKARQTPPGRRRAPKARRVEVLSIASRMMAHGLPDHFIARAVNLSQEFEGILNLMRMWRDEAEPSEREATVATIQELIDDCAKIEVSKPLIDAGVRAEALGAFLDEWEKENGSPTSDELLRAGKELKPR